MASPARSIVVGGIGGFGLSLMLVWIPVLGPVLCCTTMFGTGLLAVWHYVGTGGQAVTGRQGVAMGAQAGLVAFIASTVLLSVSWLVAGRPNLATQLRAFDTREAVNISPEVMQQAAALLDSPQAVLTLVVTLAVLYVVFGLMGGGIGAGLFKPGAPP